MKQRRRGGSIEDFEDGWIDGYDLRRAAGCLVAEVSLMGRHVHQG